MGTTTETYNATCTYREEVNPNLYIIRVRSDQGPIEFRAGQYATLGLLVQEPRIRSAAPDPKPRPPDYLLRRPYSIASGANQREHLEFIVTYVPEGEQSPRLCNLAIGDRLYCAPRVKGKFTLDLARPGKHLILIATGTGIAPFMSYVRTHHSPSDPRRWVILHGARFSWDLGYRSELETIDRLCENFTYIASITRPHADPFFVGPTGRIPDLLSQGILEEGAGVTLSPDQAEVFLCGNPDMIRATTEWLESERGFRMERARERGTIHTEEYW